MNGYLGVNLGLITKIKLRWLALAHPKEAFAVNCSR
jgi:hypothetical protein